MAIVGAPPPPSLSGGIAFRPAPSSLSFVNAFAALKGLHGLGSGDLSLSSSRRSIGALPLLLSCSGHSSGGVIGGVAGGAAAATAGAKVLWCCWR